MNKLKCIFTAVLMMCCMSALAETQTVPYRYPVYNIDGDATSGVKEWRDGSAEAIRITGSESVLGKAGTETWYYVDCLNFTATVTDSITVCIQNGLDIKGTVHFILCDMPNENQILCVGKPNTNRPGINTEGATLVIYGQKSGSGKLSAYGGEGGVGDYNGSPGIGSSPAASDDDIPAPGGTVIINGGIVTATGGMGGAGIGGAGSTSGTGGMGGTVIINGGTVEATGKYGAGIGGGRFASGGTVTINGGTVTAKSHLGAGIGGGNSVSDGDLVSGGTVTINGGTVTALGQGRASSGIGAGGKNGVGANLIINGGTVTAQGCYPVGGNESVDIGGPGFDENQTALTTITGGALKFAGESIKDSTITTRVSISGGIFSLEPKGEWLEDGCNVIQNDDETTKDEFPWAIERNGDWHKVTYGENITVSPTFISGTSVPSGTQITFTAADRTADGYEFIGFYKESTFATPITDVSGQTYTVTVTDAPISVYAKYKDNRVPTTYIDEKGVSHNVEANVADDYTNNPVTWGETGKTTWYVVKSKDARLLGGVVCQGDVNLILADGANLIANLFSNKYKAGIQVSGEGNSLTIYGQAEQTGTLKAYGGESAAGIGGTMNENGSNITINGGIVGVNGGKYAAGIGGGASSSGSNITINGGKVTAYGDMYGAGIGGGYCNPGSNITITGGTVTAYGGTSAAGIGGGYQNMGYTSNIVITGGTVTVNGGEGADGIGNGASARYAASNITVGATHIVKAGDSENPTDVIENTGADLASSLAGKRYAIVEPRIVSYIDKNGEMQTANAIEVKGSTTPVTWGKFGVDSWYVVTGTDMLLYGGAVCQGNVNLILADGAKLTARGVDNLAGIQADENNSLTIYGQTAQSGQLIAFGGDNGAAGIGCQTNSEYGSNITINGGMVTAVGGIKGGAGIGGGRSQMGYYGSKITINGGTVTALGGNSGVGIGGGTNGAISTYITITGGTVTATSGDYGVGIGGHNEGDIYNVTITGGTVIATGGAKGAGIGCSCHVNITGGTVIATGGSQGPGFHHLCNYIFVATNLIVKAGDSENPTDVIENTGSTLAFALAGKHCVTVTEPIFNLTANQDPNHKENYYATFYSSWNAYQVPENVTAYTGAVNGSVLKLTAITDGIIPAGKGVILRLTSEDNTATKQQIALTATTETGTWSGINALTGTNVEKTLGANDYALSLGQNGVGFYLWENKSIGAHKAYLTLSSDAKALTFEFDMPTGIEESLTPTLSEGEGAMYNLNGMRVGNNYKGIVIKNGKKYLKK